MLVGCVSSRDPQRWASMTAADQVAKGKRVAEAEALWSQALAEAERSGHDDWRVAYTLQRMARFYESQGRKDEAEQAFKRTLAIEEKIAPRGPTTARTVTDLAHLYQSTKRRVRARFAAIASALTISLSSCFSQVSSSGCRGSSETVHSTGAYVTVRCYRRNRGASRRFGSWEQRLGSVGQTGTPKTRSSEISGDLRSRIDGLGQIFAARVTGRPPEWSVYGSTA